MARLLFTAHFGIGAAGPLRPEDRIPSEHFAAHGKHDQTLYPALEVVHFAAIAVPHAGDRLRTPVLRRRKRVDDAQQTKVLDEMLDERTGQMPPGQEP